MRRAWVLLALLCLAAGQKHMVPVPAQVSARVEAVARAICRARGINPDHVGPPYPQGPVWEFFIPEAIEFLKELDAAQSFTGPDRPVILVPSK